MNAEIGMAIESALAHIAQSITSSMRAYANIHGGYYKEAYRDAIVDALYYAYKQMPYGKNDDYKAFITEILNDARGIFIDKVEFDIDSYN